MDKDKFAPRTGGTKGEKTGERNSEYSAWHRTLGPDYYAIDIDFVEYRMGKGIVAFMAVTGKCVDENHIMNSKPYIWQRTTMEREILLILSQKVNVPAFFVIHTNDLQIFHVHKIGDDLKEYKKMNRQEYGEFIKGL